MSKVIKILFSLLSTVILSLIILPVVLSLLLALDSVQNFAVRKATEFISNKLETKVSIDRVSIKLFNKVALNGLYVEDYQRDTLLYAGQIVAGVTSFGLMGGDLTLGDVELRDTKFYLMQTDEGISNLKQILEKLKSDKPKSTKSFKMKAGSLKIENLTFRHKKKVIPYHEYGVNFSDLAVDDLNMSVDRISIIDDSISLRINNISLRDKSGLVINSLSSNEFIISSTSMLFNKLRILTPESQVDMPYLNMTYKQWGSYSEYISDVYMEGEIVDSKISFQTIAYFAPGLRRWKSTLENVTATVSGPVAAMRGSIKHARVQQTEIAVDFHMYGIPDIDKTKFMFDVKRLVTNGEDIAYIAEDITGKPFVGADKILGNLSDVSLIGYFNGMLSKFNANATINTSLGDAQLKLGFEPSAKDVTAFKGDVAVSDFNLGKLLSVDKLGRGSVSAKVDGLFKDDSISLNTLAQVPKLEFNGYSYNSIRMSGSINNRNFKGNILSSDPNLLFDFNGLLDFNDSVPRYDFSLDLTHADLHKLNFNKRDSISRLKCNIIAHGSSMDIDNINARVHIDNLLYVNHIDSVHTGSIELIGDNSTVSKHLALRSSFADAEFKSRMSYKTLYDYLANSLRYYLPTLSPHDKLARESVAKHDATSINSYSMLRLNVKQANNVAGIFLPGLILAQGSELSLLVNPNAEQFSLSLKSDYIERDNFFISKLDINSRNIADSLSLYVRAEDLYAGGFYMPDFSVIGGAKNNKVNLSTRFSDKVKGVSALLGVVARLERNKTTDAPQIRMSFTPSTFTNEKQTWRISARDILYDSTKIAVENFRIVSQGQELHVSGVASRSLSDTLHISLSNFDVRPFSQFTDRMGYSVQGYTNGHADLVSALNKGILYARIDLDSLRVNDVAIPDSRFESKWDFQRERARFTLAERASRDTVIVGYYRPTDGRVRADVNLKGVDLSLLNPIMSGVIGQSKGSADAVLMLTGTSKAPSLNGEIRIPRFTTTVDFTNVPYTLTDALIEVKDNKLIINKTMLKDPEGNEASLDMNVDLNSFSNIKYNIGVKPVNMLVLNTTAKQNELFYGHVYATGGATIKGDKRGVNMDIAATTSRESEFYMPLSSKSSVSQSDMVVFESAMKPVVDSSNYLIRKKMMFERAKKTGSSVRSNLNINLALNVRPNTDFQLVIDPTVGDVVKARGNGTLNIHINPQSNEFTMYGDYEITEGSYLFTLQNIINKKFIIEPGSIIQWTGDPIDAMLNITAIYKLKASLGPLLNTSDASMRRTVPVECEIHLADRLAQPNITFGVTVPNADTEMQSLISNALGTQEMMATQFFWLLAANSFYADNTGSSQSMNIGAVVSSATAFEFLSNQISNWISSDKFDIGIRYRPKTDMNSDEVNIDFSTQLFSNRLLLEVEGNYDTGNNTAMTNSRSASNLTGDFYLTWLIDRAGSLKAKVFSRTIDSFDENQGLQETGIGVYYKEDFNSFKDILKNLKERFSRKNKPKKDK